MNQGGPNALLKIYTALYHQYGAQGWWPLMDAHDLPGVQKGYHPTNFDLPETEQQRFEIAIGAILTQNTNWQNVQKALKNLHSQQCLSIQGIHSLTDDRLEQLIRPSGYYSQKAKKIRHFCQLVLALNQQMPTREQLLSVWGIGPETADSILLYAWKQPVFVVDAYTRRILSHLGFMAYSADYHEFQTLFHEALPSDWRFFQEYHALLVVHAKYFYSRKPWGQRINPAGVSKKCQLMKFCKTDRMLSD